MVRLKRVGIYSMFKVGGITYALMGLAIGAVISIVSLVGGAMGSDKAGPFALFFGAAAIILLPIVYGLMGAIFGAIGAAIYNIVARVVGGLELDLQ